MIRVSAILDDAAAKYNSSRNSAIQFRQLAAVGEYLDQKGVRGFGAAGMPLGIAAGAGSR
jgi:hypothetical protein